MTTLYLTTDATSSPAPTTSYLLATSANSSEQAVDPGEFGTTTPGDARAGQWNPGVSVGSTTTATEIDGAGTNTDPVRGTTAPTTTNSPSSPSGTAVGDLVVVFMHTTSTGFSAPSHTLQSGFTLIGTRQPNNSAGGQGGRVSVACKIATSGGANSYNAFTSSNGTDYAGILVIKGDQVDSANISKIQFSFASDIAGSSTVPDPPATTVPNGTCILVTGSGVTLSSTTVTATAPTNYTLQMEVSGSAGAELCVATRLMVGVKGTSENPASFGGFAGVTGSILTSASFTFGIELTPKQETTSRRGWLYDTDLAGQRIESSDGIKAQLRLVATQGTTGTGRVCMRVSVVEKSGGAWVNKKQLLDTFIQSASSMDLGQDGWASQTNGTITVTNSAGNKTAWFPGLRPHTFASGERLLIELGFCNAGGNDQTWELLHNTGNSFIEIPTPFTPGASNNPNNVGSSVLWFDSETGVTSSGGNISAIDDQSTLDVDISQVSSPKQPNLVSNTFLGTKPSIQFTRANSDFLERASTLSTTGGFAFFIAGKFVSGQENHFYSISDPRSVFKVSTAVGAPNAGVLAMVSPSGTYTLEAGFAIDTTTFHTFAGVVDEATGIARLFIDGVCVASAGGWESDADFSSKTIRVGTDSATTTINAHIAEGAMFTGPLTGEEVLELHTYSNARWNVVNYPITAALGTFTLSGQASLRKIGMPADQVAFALSGPAPTLAVKMPADQSSFLLSGPSGTTFNVARKIFSDQVAFLLSGQAASRKISMPGELGSFSIAGQDTGLNFGFRIDGDLVSFSLTGQTADIRAQRKLTSQLGSLSFSGQNASLLTAFLFHLDVGLFALSGQTAALRRAFPAETGFLSFSGQPASLERGASVVANNGSFLLSGGDVVRNLRVYPDTGYFGRIGKPATLSASRIFHVDTGALGLSGQDAGFLVYWRLPTSRVKFDLGGQDASFLRTIQIVAAFGTFTRTGNPAGLFAHRELELAKVDFAFTGFGANFTAPRRMVSDSGTYDVVGQSVSLRGQRRIPISQVDFAFAGQLASLRFGHAVIATHGSFTVAGQSAGVRTQRKIFADVDQFSRFTFNARRADFYRGLRVIGQHGAFGVVGQDASFLRTIQIVAAVRLFALTGFGVNLIIPERRSMAAAHGTFAMIGQAANVRYGATLLTWMRTYGVTGFPATLDRRRWLTAAMRTFAVTRFAADLVRRLFVGVHADVGEFILTGGGSVPVVPGRITVMVLPYTTIETNVVILPITTITTRVRMTQPLEVGDFAAIPIAFRNSITDALGNPSAWTLTIQRVQDERGNSVDDEPTIYTYGVDSELTLVSTGNFLGTIPCTASGKWTYIVSSTGTLPGVARGIYYVSGAPS